MINLSKEMQEFLLYSYFGIDTKDNNQTITRRCMEMAYRDVARTLKYFYSTKDLEGMTKNQKDEKKKFENKKESFKNDIFSIIENNNNNDTTVASIIEEVKKIADKQDNLWKEEFEFSFGQAQKWVNMTFKYLYLFGLCQKDVVQLDVPIDSYIIKAAKSDGTEYGLAIKGVTEKAWSNWDKCAYDKFQKEIKEMVKVKFKNFKNVFEWECKAWIEVAKIESNN